MIAKWRGLTVPDTPDQLAWFKELSTAVAARGG